MAIGNVEFEYICGLVKEKAALVLEPGKEYLVESRLDPIASQEGFSSLGHLIQRLRTNPFGPLHRRVIEAMTINETSFFRDPRPFEVLRTLLLPQLIKNRGDQRALHVWFAASSTGQEPYSFAMLLREHFPSVLNWDLRLMASDISRDVLARAREGVYTQLEVNRGLPAPLLIKYFKKDRDLWRLNPEVRRMVEFHEINLMEPWPAMPRLDIVFMRNVLIYFDVGMKKNILSRVGRMLKPDGCLLLGGAESTVYLDDSFQPVPPERPSAFQLRH